MENQNLVELVEGQVMADSRKVAEAFGMEHKNVLRSISGILAAQNCAAKLFTESSFENRGKQYPMYLMNRDGFTLSCDGVHRSEGYGVETEVHRRIQQKWNNV